MGHLNEAYKGLTNENRQSNLAKHGVEGEQATGRGSIDCPEVQDSEVRAQRFGTQRFGPRALGTMAQAN